MNYEPLYTFAEKHRVPYNELCTALRAALAAPQPEPVAYVPRCHTDGNYCIVGEYKWDEIEEKPFGLADPAHWECAALYAAPPAAPAPADWGTPHDVSGAPWGAPAPAVCDGGTCGLGGYCTNCPRLSAAPAVPDDAALNTLAKLFHNGEEIEGDNGAAMMVDMALWHEASEAFDSLIGEGDDETLASSAAPAVPLTDEQFADIVAEASLAVDLAANPLKLLAFARAVLSAAPAVREPQDERIRWRDAVIKEAESALRTAEQEFADMPTWANVGHAAKKVTHALAVIAALGIGGGGK